MVKSILIFKELDEKIVFLSGLVVCVRDSSGKPTA